MKDDAKFRVYIDTDNYHNSVFELKIDDKWVNVTELLRIIEFRLEDFSFYDTNRVHGLRMDVILQPDFISMKSDRIPNMEIDRLSRMIEIVSDEDLLGFRDFVNNELVNRGDDLVSLNIDNKLLESLSDEDFEKMKKLLFSESVRRENRHMFGGNGESEGQLIRKKKQLG